jgi:hypothetical protein
MHLSPCEVVASGFNCIVVLPKDTNTPLAENKEKAFLLRQKNKWLIAHESAQKLIEMGNFPGIYGPSWEIEPVG